MFARDFNALNDLYNKKIINESVGLGPKADQDVVPTVDKIVKVNAAPKRPCGNEQEEHCAAAAKGCICGKCSECAPNKSEDCEGYDPSTYDSNGQMAKQLLFRCAKVSAMLHDLLAGKDNVEAWVLSKITNAHDQLESVYSYEDYEAVKNPMHGTCGDTGNLEENNEEDLFSAIAHGGEHLINNLKSVLRKESKENLEKVLLETILILEEKNKK